MEVTGKVQVHVFHRNDLRVTATRSAALHTEVWPKRCFTDTNSCFFANAVQTITKAHGCCGFAFTRWSWVNCSHKDQFTAFVTLNGVDEFLADLGFVVAVGKQIIRTNAQFCANLLDRLLVRFARNFDVGLICHGAGFPIDVHVSLRRW